MHFNAQYTDVEGRTLRSVNIEAQDLSVALTKAAGSAVPNQATSFSIKELVPNQGQNTQGG